MDERMRELERRARAGAQDDIDALMRARLQCGDTKEQAICYLEGHVRFEWWYGAKTAQQMANRLHKTQLDWRICLRCKLKEQLYYHPPRCTSSTTITISDETASNDALPYNITVPYTTISDVPVEPVSTSRGSRYEHPTKRRAWRERARLSKRELKRRKQKHR